MQKQVFNFLPDFSLMKNETQYIYKFQNITFFPLEKGMEYSKLTINFTANQLDSLLFKIIQQMYSFQEVKEIASLKNNKYIHLVSVLVIIKK